MLYLYNVSAWKGVKAETILTISFVFRFGKQKEPAA